MRRFQRTVIAALLSSAAATALCAQQTPQPIALTLRRTLELALQNSKDIKIARIQASVADRAGAAASPHVATGGYLTHAGDLRAVRAARA